MEYQTMKISLNKNKSIGKVLYIVEGAKTEPYILWKLFADIFDYQVETLLRDKKYHKYNSKLNPNSQVFVINAEESNIKYIDKDSEFLDNLYKELIENYDFDIDNSAIYYVFDRDNRSNTNAVVIKNLIASLSNARENENYLRPGLLLLSYPSIESFTLSNFQNESFKTKIDTGYNLKLYLHEHSCNHQNITGETLVLATNEFFKALELMNINNFDLDNLKDCNMDIFDFQEASYLKEKVYRVLSLLSVSLIDLGLIDVL